VAPTLVARSQLSLSVRVIVYLHCQLFSHYNKRWRVGPVTQEIRRSAS
jgi:hypothetical protein